MGGEPTFVSVDDRDGAEWNTDGARARPSARCAAELLRPAAATLRAAAASLHYGQGKWYPGEPLPRWALDCYWRADGEPVWHDPALFADERQPDGHGATEAAARSSRALAERLGVDRRATCSPAYEDVWYYLWRERRLPVNVDPFDARLDDELERARLRRVFEQRPRRGRSATRCRSRAIDDGAPALAHAARGSCATSGCT